MKLRRLLVSCLAVITVAAAASGAPAQDYPTRPVTIVVPFTPAGTTDILARMVGERLEQRLGKAFLIENRPGAGMQIGMTAVAKSAPDGYTLLVAPSSGFAVNVTLYKKLPYDPVKDFTPLAVLMAELVAYAKEHPGQLSFGSGGVGASHHLYGELLKSLAGLQMTHVPYKGTVPALNDVVAGHIPLLFSDVPPALQLIRTGKVRALGVTTAKRIAVAPEIPPIAGTVAGFDSAPWQMLAARADTPAAIVDKLHSEAMAMLASPDVQKRMLDMGLVPGTAASAPELERFLASEIERWGKIVHLAGAAGSQ
jgi:tripartite-type tricarboxylate transporter receptor subunit TctC